MSDTRARWVADTGADVVGSMDGDPPPWVTSEDEDSADVHPFRDHKANAIRHFRQQYRYFKEVHEVHSAGD